MNKAEELGETTEVRNFDLAGISFLISTVLMVPVVLIEQEFHWIVTFYMANLAWSSVSGIFSTGVAYLFFYKGLSMVEASEGINLFYIKPVITTIANIIYLFLSPSLFILS